MCPCTLSTHTSTAPVCMQFVDITPNILADLYASRVLSVHPSAVQLSDARDSSAGTAPPVSCRIVICLCAGDRAAAALSTARTGFRPRSLSPAAHRRGLAEMACDQSFPCPGTAALTLSHARSQRHDQTCRPLLVTAPRKLGTSLRGCEAVISRSHPSQRTGSDSQGGRCRHTPFLLRRSPGCDWMSGTPTSDIGASRC